MAASVFSSCLAAACTAACFTLAACGGKAPAPAPAARTAVDSPLPQFTAPEAGRQVAVFTTSEGEFRAALYPEAAPQAVENFIGLAEQGYYSGAKILFSEPGFCIKAGDATGTGTGGATIWNSNGFAPEISESYRHYAGALCMALDTSAPEAGIYSVFYIVTAPQDSVDEAKQAKMREAGWSEDVIAAYAAAGGVPELDLTDTVFGQVYEGLDAVDRLNSAETDENGVPAEELVIESVRIETLG